MQAPQSIEQLIALAANTVKSPATFENFTRQMRVSLPGPLGKHVGVFSGQRVQDFQNWLLFENYKRKLTDGQLLAIMRAEFPQAEGTVFTGKLAAALPIISGIRAHFNRDGHNGKSPLEWGLPPSESYGTW